MTAFMTNGTTTGRLPSDGSARSNVPREAASDEVVRGQIEDMGFKVEGRDDSGGHYAIATMRRYDVDVRLTAYDLHALLPVARCVWTGLHE